MTTTDDGPRLITMEDAPTTCPAWCEGHPADYLSDLNEGLVDGDEPPMSREDALAQFQTHSRSIADRPVLGLATAGGRVRREAGGYYNLSIRREPKALTFVNLFLSARPSGVGTHPLTAGEARSLAAQLVRAADLVDAEHER